MNSLNFSHLHWFVSNKRGTGTQEESERELKRKWGGNPGKKRGRSPGERKGVRNPGEMGERKP